MLYFNPSTGPFLITSEEHLYMPNEFYESFPKLVTILAPSGMPTINHSDTPHGESSWEPSSSPIFEESAIIIPSRMPTRDH